MPDIIEETLTAAHELAQQGLSPGSSGNISCRINDSAWLSASGTLMSTITRTQLAQIDLLTQQTPTHAGPRPSKEAPLHLALYRSNPRMRCIVHLHSPAASAAACLPAWSKHCALPPLSPYTIMRVGNLPLIPYEHPGSPVLADHLMALEVPFDCALLQNHGLIASGSTVSEAVNRSIEIEQAADLALKLGHFKSVNTLTDVHTDELAKRNGRPWGMNDYRVSC